jgi:hypothetical protein
MPSCPGGLCDQLRRKPWPRRSTSWTSITSVAGAILVYAPALGRWYLLQGQAVAISRTTGIYASFIGSPAMNFAAVTVTEANGSLIAVIHHANVARTLN